MTEILNSQNQFKSSPPPPSILPIDSGLFAQADVETEDNQIQLIERLCDSMTIKDLNWLSELEQKQPGRLQNVIKSALGLKQEKANLVETNQRESASTDYEAILKALKARKAQNFDPFQVTQVAADTTSQTPIESVGIVQTRTASTDKPTNPALVRGL